MVRPRPRRACRKSDLPAHSFCTSFPPVSTSTRSHACWPRCGAPCPARTEQSHWGGFRSQGVLHSAPSSSRCGAPPSGTARVRTPPSVDSPSTTRDGTGVCAAPRARPVRVKPSASHAARSEYQRSHGTARPHPQSRTGRGGIRRRSTARCSPSGADGEPAAQRGAQMPAALPRRPAHCLRRNRSRRPAPPPRRSHQFPAAEILVIFDGKVNPEPNAAGARCRSVVRTCSTSSGHAAHSARAPQSTGVSPSRITVASPKPARNASPYRPLPAEDRG